MLIIPFTTFLVIWCCSALTCVSSSQVGRNNGFKIEQYKIICAHHIINNIAVSTGYIHQVEKYPQVKSNSWFLIQMINCNPLSVKSSPHIFFLFYVFITSGKGSGFLMLIFFTCEDLKMLLLFLQHYWTTLLLKPCSVTSSKLPC